MPEIIDAASEQEHLRAVDHRSRLHPLRLHNAAAHWAARASSRRRDGMSMNNWLYLQADGPLNLIQDLLRCVGPAKSQDGLTALTAESLATIPIAGQTDHKLGQ